MNNEERKLRKKEYDKKYGETHKEEIRIQKQKYAKEHREQRKTYLQRPEVKEQYKKTSKKWKENHPEQVKESLRKWYRTHKEQVRKISQEQRKVLENLIGSKCIVCDSNRYIQFHEIHNKKHPISFSYYFEHLKDFVPLCQRCHSTKTRFLELNNTQRAKLLAI